MHRSSYRNGTVRYYTKPVYLIQVLMIIAFIILPGCSFGGSNYNINSAVISKETRTVKDNVTNLDESQKLIGTQESAKLQGSNEIENSALDDQLEITFLDVGQADSILISQGQNHMLIDAGNNADADQVTNYLKNKGIIKLDYVIGTHAHEDHIGGLDAVISRFDIGKVLIPKQVSTTKTFEDVLMAIKNKNMKVTVPKAGDVYNLGKAKWTILAPNKEEYEDINNSSIVIRMTFGDNSFLFMGDAEELSEQEILANKLEVKSDLIKIGHHGSNSSTSSVFLKKVMPKYAVISVGKDNSYNHPDSLVLNRLKTFGAEVFRTDEFGTIIVTSDAHDIKFNKKASAKKEQAPPAGSEARDADSGAVKNLTEETESKEVTVYVTKTGGKYHLDGCKYLGKGKKAISLNNAKSQGYTPCSRCIKAQ